MNKITKAVILSYSWDKGNHAYIANVIDDSTREGFVNQTTGRDSFYQEISLKDVPNRIPDAKNGINNSVWFV